MQTEQFMTFFTAHWQLALLFCVLLFLLIGLEIRNRLLGVPRLSTAQVTQAINHQDAVLLDVRTKEQFAQGHILGALNKPWEEFMKQTSFPNFDKQKPIIILCEAGQTAQKAAALLRTMGFVQASILQGGLMTWRGAGLPLVKKGGK